MELRRIFGARVAIGLGGISLALVAACGGSDGGTGNTNPPPSAITIHLLAQSFSPAVDTLAAGPGNSVTWVWDTDNHNVHSFGADTFIDDTVTHTSPHTFAVTLPNPGDFRFYCSQHGTQLCNGGDMCGRIVVR